MRAPILITGGSGFVGRHLQAQLGARAVATEADVTDAEALREVVRDVAPEAVVHLAARASVGSSWAAPAAVWEVNAIGTVNVLEAVGRDRPAARTLVASTGEVYGRPEQIPATEDSPVAPLSPYAASKAAAEVACGRAARADGLDVVVTRAFMHIGPGQDEAFAVGSWTRQIASPEADGGGTLRVGNLSARRDITDVRDVCRAYALLIDGDVPAGTYNVASGRAVAMSEVVERLVAMARFPIAVETDPSRLRPVDVPVACGDASRLARATGWKPEIPFERTLADALDDARRAVARQEVATT